MPTTVRGTLAVLIDGPMPAELGSVVATGTDVDVLRVADMSTAIHHDNVVIAVNDLARAGDVLRMIGDRVGASGTYVVAWFDGGALEQFDAALRGFDAVGVLLIGQLRAIRVATASDGEGTLGRIAWLEATAEPVPAIVYEEPQALGRASREASKPAKRRPRRPAVRRGAALLRKRYLVGGGAGAIMAAVVVGWIVDGTVGALRDAMIVAVLVLNTYLLVRTRAFVMHESSAAAKFRSEERRVRAREARRDARVKELLTSLDAQGADVHVVVTMMLESLKEKERGTR